MSLSAGIAIFMRGTTIVQFDSLGTLRSNGGRRTVRCSLIRTQQRIMLFGVVVIVSSLGAHRSLTEVKSNAVAG